MEMELLQETADQVPDIEAPSLVPVKDTGTPLRTQPKVTLDPSSVPSTVPVGQSVFVLSTVPLKSSPDWTSSIVKSPVFPYPSMAQVPSQVPVTSDSAWLGLGDAAGWW